MLCVGVPSREQPLYFLFSPEISPFNSQSFSHSIVKRGAALSVFPCAGAAVGLSKSSALPCHRHSVFQVKDVKFGTKGGFQVPVVAFGMALLAHYYL